MSSHNEDPHDHDLLTITEAADPSAHPSPPCATGATSAPDPAASDSAAASSTRADDFDTWITEQHDHDGPTAA
jgi:hypothetical protein